MGCEHCVHPRKKVIFGSFFGNYPPDYLGTILKNSTDRMIGVAMHANPSFLV